MPTTRKLLCWLLLATLPCLSLRCNTFCDGCPEPPCAGQYRGGLALRPTTGRWLPLPAPDTISFINANGFRARLDLLPSPGADSVTLPAFAGVPSSYDESYLNPSYAPCGPYFRAKRLAMVYQGRNVNLRLQFNLFKNLGAAPALATGPAPLTRAVADTLPDVLVLKFNEQYEAHFPVAGTPYRQPRLTPQGETVYLDSVRLVGRTFRGVYQFSRRPSGAAVQPQRFFFRPGQGLVGFTYTNNEQWARL